MQSYANQGKVKLEKKALWNEVANLMEDTFLQVTILFQIYGDLLNLSRFSEYIDSKI